jgi:hypothetical protein
MKCLISLVSDEFLILFSRLLGITADAINRLVPGEKKFNGGRQPVESLVDLLRYEPLIYQGDVCPKEMITRLFLNDEAVHITLRYQYLLSMVTFLLRSLSSNSAPPSMLRIHQYASDRSSEIPVFDSCFARNAFNPVLYVPRHEFAVMVFEPTVLLLFRA